MGYGYAYGYGYHPYYYHTYYRPYYHHYYHPYYHRYYHRPYYRLPTIIITIATGDEFEDPRGVALSFEIWTIIAGLLRPPRRTA